MKRCILKRVAITGTPGTGKTSVSRILSEKLQFPVYHLSRLVEEKFHSGFDRQRNCFIADVEALRKFFAGIDAFIAEGVVAHYIDYDVLVVLRTEPAVLATRLKERGYGEEKVRENVEAERLAVCAGEAVAFAAGKLVQINTTYRSPEETASLIVRAVQCEDIFEDVDWLEECSGCEGEA